MAGCAHIYMCANDVLLKGAARRKRRKLFNIKQIWHGVMADYKKIHMHNGRN